VVVEYVKERRKWKVQIGERISQVKTKNLAKSMKRRASTKENLDAGKQQSRRGRKAPAKRRPDVKNPDDAFTRIIEFLETVEISSRFAEKMDETTSELELLRSRFQSNEKVLKRQELKMLRMQRMLDRANPEGMDKAGEDAEKIETLTKHVNNLSTQLELMIDEHEAMSKELQAANHDKHMESQGNKEKLAKVNQVCQELADQLEETSGKLRQAKHQNKELVSTFNSQLLMVENENKELQLELEALRRENARLKNKRA